MSIMIGRYLGTLSGLEWKLHFLENLLQINIYILLCQRPSFGRASHTGT